MIDFAVKESTKIVLKAVLAAIVSGGKIFLWNSEPSSRTDQIFSDEFKDFIFQNQKDLTVFSELADIQKFQQDSKGEFNPFDILIFQQL